MQQCIQNLLFHVYMKLNMFWTTHRPSSGAQNCTSSLWFCIRERLLDVEAAGRRQRLLASRLINTLLTSYCMLHRTACYSQTDAMHCLTLNLLTPTTVGARVSP
jgi:hypothetical protein